MLHTAIAFSGKWMSPTPCPLHGAFAPSMVACITASADPHRRRYFLPDPDFSAYKAQPHDVAIFSSPTHQRDSRGDPNTLYCCSFVLHYSFYFPSFIEVRRCPESAARSQEVTHLYNHIDVEHFRPGGIYNEHDHTFVGYYSCCRRWRRILHILRHRLPVSSNRGTTGTIIWKYSPPRRERPSSRLNRENWTAFLEYSKGNVD